MSRFSPSDRLRSFGHAFRGLGFVLRTQHNAWIHVAATLAVVVVGIVLDVSRMDWCWLILAIGAVGCAEAFNTALEELADAVDSEPNPLIGRAKDAAAGAVLIAALAAAAIGVMILGPPLWEIL
ncbi:MAG: diacylglycerol kinase family protein [Myxococcota bacterium]|nr:diacylglycerol kinase family protein [Myxococcota bacterium]